MGILFSSHKYNFVIGSVDMSEKFPIIKNSGIQSNIHICIQADSEYTTYKMLIDNILKLFPLVPEYWNSDNVFSFSITDIQNNVYDIFDLNQAIKCKNNIYLNRISIIFIYNY